MRESEEEREKFHLINNVFADKWASSQFIESTKKSS